MSVTAYILLGCRTATGVPENIMLAILKCGVLIENPEFQSEAKKSENTQPKAETTQVCDLQPIAPRFKSPSRLVKLEKRGSGMTFAVAWTLKPIISNIFLKETNPGLSVYKTESNNILKRLLT